MEEIEQKNNTSSQEQQQVDQNEPPQNVNSDHKTDEEMKSAEPIEDIGEIDKTNLNKNQSVKKDEPPQNSALDHLFDDDMEVDDSPLDLETYRILAKYDDPWADLKDPHVMINFYKYLFPWKPLFLWLNQDHVPNYAFTNREFAVTLQNDAYLRYNSYSNHLDLQKDIIRLNPTRFEIGPAYSVPPKDKKSVPKSAFKPLLRELVFDIDLTDYDDVRKCCQDKKICKKCWKLISMAVEVLDLTLRHDFGFRHLLWVYSGRRGIHCWVSDEEALKLNDEQRRAIVNYLDIMRGGGSKSGLKVDLKPPFHPAIERSFNILMTQFSEVALEDQEVFQGEDKWKFFEQLWLDRGPSDREFKEFRAKLQSQWVSPAGVSSQEKWRMVDEAFNPEKNKNSSGKNAKKKYFDNKEVFRNIVLHYTYPRIDLEVSKHMNHLLKSPFCVHPGTGKVCVPIDPTRVREFDPDTVPDVRDLLRELDKHSQSNAIKDDGSAADSVSTGWSKTSLKPYVELFEKHVNAIIKSKLKAKKTLNNQVTKMDY